MKAAARTATVARSTTEAPKPQPSPVAALQVEFKRRVDGRVTNATPPPPASSIKEALARWLEEQL